MMEATATTPLLTAEEVAALTGYALPGKQVQELRKQGFWRARRQVSPGKTGADLDSELVAMGYSWRPSHRRRRRWSRRGNKGAGEPGAANQYLQPKGHG